VAAQELAFVWFGIGVVVLAVVLLTGRKAVLTLEEPPTTEREESR
jgi:hypothetical protein